MKRIFLTLLVISTTLLIITLALGLNIGTWKTLNRETQRPELMAAMGRISTHMLSGMAALTFTTLVHAITFTYFMGTGRWLEETSQAYSLDGSYHARNQSIKYRLLMGMTVGIALIIATGAMGAAADPATPINLDGTLGMTGTQLHFTVAITTLVTNLIVNFSEFIAISRNSRIVESVLAEVKRIREERGLPV